MLSSIYSPGSPTWDWTYVSYSGSSESQPLDNRVRPWHQLFIICNFIVLLSENVACKISVTFNLLNFSSLVKYIICFCKCSTNTWNEYMIFIQGIKDSTVPKPSIT